VPAPTTLHLFEDIVQPERLGFTLLKKNLFGKQASTDIVHLLKLQAIKGGSFTLWWGVSLSYVPHKWQTELEWHRTFKSSRFDLFEEPLNIFTYMQFIGAKKKNISLMGYTVKPSCVKA
jgi:hypothetical protein